MRILLVNQPWFYEYLRDKGYHVEIARNDNEFKNVIDKGEQFDVVLFLDNSAPIDPLPLLGKDYLLAYYVVDSHLHLEEQLYLSSIFDVVFVAQKCHVELFRQANPNTIWLPLFSSPATNGTAASKRPMDVTFVGHLNRECHQDRKIFLEKVSKVTPLKIIQAPWDQIYPNSKIVVNKSINNDLNFRVFEALASGCLLITDHIDSGLYDLFTPWEHLLVYESIDECVELIEYVLRHLDVLDAIAQNGHELFRRCHTEACRAEVVISELARTKREGGNRFKRSVLAELGLLKWYYKISLKSGHKEISNGLKHKIHTIERQLLSKSITMHQTP